jgi:hypothetical protein
MGKVEYIDIPWTISDIGAEKQVSQLQANYLKGSIPIAKTIESNQQS